MNIGIDLDDTLANTKALIERVRTEYKVNGLPYDWHFTGYPEDFKKAIKTEFVSEAMNNLEIFPGVVTTLAKLHETNKIYIITARAEPIRAGTIKFIEDQIIYKDGIFFVDIGESKAETFKKLKLDMWIDDAPHDLETAKAMGIYTVMISNDNTPYNHHLREKVRWSESFDAVFAECFDCED